MDPHQDTVNAKRSSSPNIDEPTENNNNNSDVLSSNPLELMKDFVEEPSSSIKVIGETTIKSSQITLNGEPLVALSTQDDEVSSIQKPFLIKPHLTSNLTITIRTWARVSASPWFFRQYSFCTVFYAFICKLLL